MAQFHAWQMQQQMPISTPGQNDPYPTLNSRPEMLQVLLQRDEQIKEMLNMQQPHLQSFTSSLDTVGHLPEMVHKEVKHP